MRRLSVMFGVLLLLSITAEVLGRFVYAYDLYLPRPVSLTRFALDYGDHALLMCGLTGIKVVGGVVLGSTCAAILSFGTIAVPRLRSPLTAAAYWSQTVPIPLLAPLIGAALGFNLLSGCAIAGLVCFFPVYLALEQGRLAIPSDTALLIATHAPSPMRYVRHILFPASLPHLLIGMRGAINLALLGSALAEFTGAGNGLGRLMLRGIRQLEPGMSWGAMILLCSMAWLMTRAIGLAKRSRRLRYLGARDVDHLLAQKTDPARMSSGTLAIGM